jgi:MYXO-CTERM domain-containing protein
VHQKENVKTLPREVFQHVYTLAAPRLVEYWEQDPCWQPPPMMRGGVVGGIYPMAAPAMAGAGLGVKIEAQFEVGEYQIVILSAEDSTGLDAYLREQKYSIPDGAEPILRPYVAAGMKFFVAKVDASKVTFEKGQAMLSPLRFHYDSDDFALPIRLGLAASPGKQDLIVNILSPEGRFNVSNYKNVTIPTNLAVKDEVRNRFAEFYAALFDRTVERNPGAVVTEYSWDASTCDPCPGPQLDYNDFATLGADVLGGAPGKVEPYQGYQMVLTRLHARYGKTDVPDDLQFGKAPSIVGGREFVIDQKTGKLEEGSREDSINNFQGRYAIRHEWTGAISCANPVRNRWGGPPAGESYTGVKAGQDLAHAPRGAVKLPQLVAQDVPEIGIKAAGGAAAPSTPAGGATPAQSGSEPTGAKTPHGKGCGCQSGGDGGGGVLLLGLVLLVVWRRR